MPGYLRPDQGFQQYRRGTILGLTVAETFILLVFVLLLLLLLWKIDEAEEEVEPATELTIFLQQLPAKEQAEVVRAIMTISDPAAFSGGVRLAAAIDDLPRQESRSVAALLAADGTPDRRKAIEDVARVNAAIGNLSPETRRILQDMARSNDLEEGLVQMTEAKEIRDLFRNEDDMYLLRRTASLASSERRELSKLLRSGGLSRSVESLEELSRLESDGWSLEDIRAAVQSHHLRTAAVAERIDSRLGEIVERYGGEIGANGVITIPNSVGFNLGKASMKQEFRDFLGEFCFDFFETLYENGNGIDEIRIEGHSSSEWRTAPSENEAFLANLDLSQRRAHTVLADCLRRIDDPELKKWVSAHITAVGFSSARPVFDEHGNEDEVGSRRVAFSYILNYDDLLTGNKASSF